MNFQRFLSVLMSLGVAGASQAAIINVAGVTSDIAPDVGALVPENLINGTGLSGAVANEADAAAVTHEGQVFGDGTNESTFTTNGGQPTLTFDLGGTFTVGQVFVWNYHDNDGFFGSTLSANGAMTAEVSFSSDGGATYGGTVTISPDEAPTTIGVEASSSVHALGGVTADHVQIKITEFFPGGDRYGLGEVRFSTVPEPAALGALVLGGLLVRRRHV